MVEFILCVTSIGKGTVLPCNNIESFELRKIDYVNSLLACTRLVSGGLVTYSKKIDLSFLNAVVFYRILHQVRENNDNFIIANTNKIFENHECDQRGESKNSKPPVFLETFICHANFEVSSTGIK